MRGTSAHQGMAIQGGQMQDSITYAPTNTRYVVMAHIIARIMTVSALTVASLPA